jgi:amino acid transporter
MSGISESLPPRSGAGDGSLEREAASGGLFIRKSSGLVREMSMRDAFSMNMALIALPAFALVPLFALGAFPGSDLTVPLLIGMLGMGILAIVYAQLTMTMPRTGADFIFSSRIFHPAIGAIVGFAMLMALLVLIGANAVAMPHYYFAFFFQAVGQALGSEGLQHFGAVTLQEKGWSFVAAMLTIVVAGALLTRGAHTAARWIWWTFVAAALGVVAYAVVLVLNGSDFQAGFNDFAGRKDAYQAVMSSAHDGGFNPGISWAAMISSLPFVVSNFWGFTWSNYAAGELRRPNKTYLPAALSALVVTAVLLLISWLALRGAAGLHFLQSAAWLISNDGTKYGEITNDAPVFAPFYALLVSHDPVSKIVMGVGWAVGYWGWMFAAFLMFSRLAFALAFDRLLPTRLAEVGARSHAPTAAIAVTIAGGTIFTVLAIYTSVLTQTRNAFLVLSAVFAISSLAVAALPYLRRDLFESGPRLIRARVAGIPAITLIGVVSACFNGYVTYLDAAKAQVSGGYDTGSIITLCIVCFGGGVCYAVSRLTLRMRGVDLDLAMRELPPE